jgi:hypothetical protein
MLQVLLEKRFKAAHLIGFGFRFVGENRLSKAVSLLLPAFLNAYPATSGKKPAPQQS